MEDFIAYHGTPRPAEPGFAFGGLDTHPEGIHLGTLEQAQARAAGGSIITVKVLVRHLSSRIHRVKDRDGAWAKTALRHRRQGHEILTYLNRHEGLSIERAIALGRHDEDALTRMSDRAFLHLAPEARDSWLILHTDLVKILDIQPAGRSAGHAIKEDCAA